MRPLGDAAKLEARRMKAVEAVENGESTVAAAAKKAKVSIRTLYKWLAAHRDEGAKGVQAKPAPGRPPRLSEKDFERLERMLVKGPEAHGFSTPLWTCSRIAEVIEKEFGVEYHPGHVARIMGKLGWTPQKPERRAIERDEAEIERWQKVEWKKIKKRPPKRAPR